MTRWKSGGGTPDHGVVAGLAERQDLSEASKREILGENGARLFRL